MPEAGSDGGRGARYDVFLSHGSPDKAWVRTLRDELEKLRLRVYLDEVELRGGQDWPAELNDALFASRAVVLVLSNAAYGREWVEHEYNACLAHHGPRSGQLIPVLLEAVDLPPFLKAIQAVRATDRKADVVARTLAELIAGLGDPVRAAEPRLASGQELAFVLERKGDTLTVIDPTGRSREAVLPWKRDEFPDARLGFARLAARPVAMLLPTLSVNQSTILGFSTRRRKRRSGWISLNGSGCDRYCPRCRADSMAMLPYAIGEVVWLWPGEAARFITSGVAKRAT